MCFYFLALQTLDHFKEPKGSIKINHLRLDLIERWAKETEVAIIVDRLREQVTSMDQETTGWKATTDSIVYS